MRKTALVTGAYKGLGLEWCRQLAMDGFEVILTARSMEKARSGSDILAEEGLIVHPKVVDVGDEGSIQNLAKEIKEEFGRLDILINNAGINAKDNPDRSVFMKNYRLEDLDPEEVLKSIRINSLGPVLMVKHFRTLLQVANPGKVINIGSWLGSISAKDRGGHYSYSGSKSALNMMNKALALEVAPEQIISVVVNPGWVKTDMGGINAKLSPEQSVRGTINNVVKPLSLSDAGKFLQWDGSEHPW